MAKRRDDLLIGPREKTIEAIKKGDKETALKCFNDTVQIYKGIHDKYGDWINVLFTFISKRMGEKAVKDADDAIMADIYEATWLKLASASHQDLIDMSLRIHRSHFSEFYVEEDDEKTTVVITACGAGGRMMKEGKFDNTDRNPMMGGTTKKGYDWSGGKVGFPYYCTHIFFFNKLSEKYGVPLRVEYGRQYDNDGNPVNEPCKYIIYKK